MSQHYSNPERENEPTALPDLEVFCCDYSECPECEEIILVATAEKAYACSEGHETTLDALRPNMQTGYFYWFCFPGCLPDSEPVGPYATEQKALDAARESAE